MTRHEFQIKAVLINCGSHCSAHLSLAGRAHRLLIIAIVALFLFPFVNVLMVIAAKQQMKQNK